MTLIDKIVTHAKIRVLAGAYLVRATSNKPLSISVAGQHFKILPDGEIAELLWRGTFEQHELALASGFLQAGMTFIDVGANSGIPSLIASRAVGDSGQVVAFEPSRETFQILQHNIALNTALNIRAEQIAVTDVGNHGVLVSPKGRGDGYRYFQAAPEELLDSDEVVNCTTLDTYAETHGLACIDMLKIDVEGGELGVLKGARELLGNSPDVLILFECYEPWCNRLGYSAASLLDFVGSQGLSVYTWDDATNQFTNDPARVCRSPILWACKTPTVLERMHAAAQLNVA